jgi:type I restriction enzyme, S subunit
MAGSRTETRTGGRPASTGVIPGDFALSVGKPSRPAPPGWRWTALSDVARLETGHTPSRRHPEYWGGNVPWIGIKDATENHGRVITDTFQHTNELGIANSSARILPVDTVCLSRTASVGYVVVMGRPMATSQDFVNWVCSEALDHRFLKYVLLAEQSAFLRFASGTTHQTIYFPEVKAFHVYLPPLPEQRAIAHILGTLDDKIELNRRMNETLEAMARALFKSWFVDFDPVRAKAEGRDPGLPQPLADLFPNSLADSEMGGIPVGWEVSRIGFIAEVIDCLHSKKPERREAGMPLLQLANIRDNGLIDMSETYFIDDSDYQKWIARMEASPGDCVITNVGRVGAVAQMPADGKAALGRNMTGVRCKSSFPFPTLLIECLLSQSMGDEIAHNIDSGTILDALNVRSIPKLRFVCPQSADVLEYFERRARPLRAQMERRLAESRTLAALRDTLLPNLVSGELRIRDAESLLSEVAT